MTNITKIAYKINHDRILEKNKMDNRPIGIFDSGVGGLTVFKEIRKLLPQENLIYFGDTARVPYGNKSPLVVQKYSLEIAKFLEMQNVKMIVIACNTASALALSSLKNEVRIPVIGVIEPGVRAAIKSAQNNSIAVIGTKATISSEAYQNRIKRLRSSINVIAIPCPLFVPIVEENLINTKIAKDAMEMYLSDLKKTNIKSVILACTHYPLLKEQISNFFDNKIELVDSAYETAKEVKETLEARRILTEQENNGKETFFVSDSPETFSNIAANFLNRPIDGKCIFHPWAEF